LVWWRRAEARQQPVRVRVAETQDPPVEQVGRHGEDGQRPDGVRLAEIDQADLDAGRTVRAETRGDLPCRLAAGTGPVDDD
jgi:hypothetical protein